jgi:glutaredoxin
MKKEKLITVGVVVLVLLIAGGIIYFKLYQGFGIRDTPAEQVAKWIGENSILYVQTGCIHCEEQEDLFGSNVRFLTIVDCLDNENTQKCIDVGIVSTPTWIINGQKYAGVQTIETLKSLTGYQD